MKYTNEINEISVSDVSGVLRSCYFIFPSQMGTVVKTGGCQQDLVLAIMSKNHHLRVKCLICCTWQGMLLPSGSMLNKIVACEWWYYWKHELCRNIIFIFLSETCPRAVLGKHADLITVNFSNSSSTASIIQMPRTRILGQNLLSWRVFLIDVNELWTRFLSEHGSMHLVITQLLGSHSELKNIGPWLM